MTAIGIRKTRSCKTLRLKRSKITLLKNTRNNNRIEEKIKVNITLSTNILFASSSSSGTTIAVLYPRLANMAIGLTIAPNNANAT